MIKIYTNQDQKYVDEYLKEKKLQYYYKSNAFYITDPTFPNKFYQYWYTTGRWGVFYYGRKFDKAKTKHYCCKDVETLVTKYIFEGKENEQHTFDTQATFATKDLQECTT
tara:strand:+ start:997 stop:1326 length:330 start_codon:yes stop_codon:yes gene_type:complete